MSQVEEHQHGNKMQIAKGYPGIIVPVRGVRLARSLVNWIDHRVRRVQWTNDEIDSKFGIRPALEVLREGKTGYMNPCIDLTLAAAATIQYNGISHRLVIEEHGKTAKTPFNHLHFAVEFEDTQGRYFINFRTGNRVQIGRGDYQGREDLPQVQIIRLPGTTIDYAEPLFKSLGYESFDEVFDKIFHGYRLGPNIEKIKRDNTDENFKSYLTACGDKFKIELL